MDYITTNSEDRLFDQISLEFDHSNSIEVPEEGLLNFLKDLYEPSEATPLLPSIQIEAGEADAGIFSQSYQSNSLFDKNPTSATEVKKSLEDSSSAEVLDKSKKSLVSSVKNKRPDIQNRKVLRLVKKFFCQLFLYHNDRLQNRRFTKVPFEETLQALEQFASVYIHRAPTEDMAQFLFRFMNLNSSDAWQLDSQAAHDGFNGFRWSQSYRSWDFQCLSRSEYFQHLIISFMELRNTPISSVVALHKYWAWENQYHTEIKKLEMVLLRLLYKKLPISVEDSLDDVYQRWINLARDKLQQDEY